MTIWLIGMSASGKTTIGKKLFDKLQDSNEKWVFLDGDTFRHILGEDLGHKVDDRKKNAYRISRLCEYFNSQDINVLACVLSIFHDNQRYNKENIYDYKEVFIDVGFEKLMQRDNKELYKKAQQGKMKDVVGIDIKFEPPYSPDLVIDNNSDNPDYEKIVDEILSAFNIKIEQKYFYTQNNLLKIPHNYQYSRFEGELFFEKFINDRKNTLQFLDKRLEKVGNPEITFLNEEYRDKEHLILKDFLINLYNSEESALIEQKNYLHILIKRFEVGKKLYLTYDLNEIRKSSSEFEELLNYPMFSLVLQKYYMIVRTEEKYLYINAILKVNDIISSIKSEFIFSDEIFYAKKAIEGEFELVEKMI